MVKNIVQTSFGKFRVTINDDYNIDPMTREITKIGKILSIGGKNNCVFISAPNPGYTVFNGKIVKINDFYTTKDDTGHLHQLNTKHGGCELAGSEVRGKKTIDMILLLFTILKQEAPHIKYLTLDDMSDFDCDLGNGETASISLALYEIMFHQDTWYARHFGAYLKNDLLRQKYEEYLRINSLFKKEKTNMYQLQNKSLEMLLIDDYANTKTWEEFFSKLYTYKNKCKLIAPWYKRVINHLMGGISFERQEWIIDLSNNKIVTIPFTLIEQSAGAKRAKYNYTKKYKKNHDTPLYLDLYNIQYTKKDLH
jgi:hypothetical protein